MSMPNYDRTRMHLNFEIGSDGKIHPLGYMDKRLDERIQERLDELEYHPFKADSKIQPNICARLIIGGNHERTLKMAFGNQTVNLNKGADNSHLHRCREVEDWAMDSYRWCCEQFGKENVIGFQVHLDEKSPHCHALVIPVGRKGKEKKKRVMWSAKFGKNGNEYKAILHAMHTSLYETVGKKYGLERGDSVEGRNVRYLDKHKFYREQLKLEKAIKGLTTMKENLECSIARLQDEIQTVRCHLSDRKIHDITEENSNLNETLCGLLDALSIPDFQEKFFTIADVLIGGCHIPTSSGGGGDTSDLRWDGRNPDEDEQSYRRRCLIAAVGVVISRSNQRGVRR